jgi:hypothetical protein
MIKSSLLAVLVIYVEVYVNPTAEGKYTLQQRVQFINISQIVGHTGFRQDSLFSPFLPCLYQRPRLRAGSYKKWLS